MLFLLIVAVIVALGIAVSAPLRSGRRAEPAGPNGESLEALEAAKESKYREIRDAELDFRTGKLSGDDYRALDRQLRHEAIAILREIDELRDEGSNPREPG